MRIVKLALQRETAMPMLALTFASVASVALVAVRIMRTGRFGYTFLVWNLFLAWLPMIFALMACERYRRTSARDWRFLALAGAWLLFFPNSGYIFTDLTHLTTHFRPYFWVDLSLILLCALTGLVLGFVSLFLIQTIVQQVLGRLAGWLMIAGVAALSGFGIYVGRFLRFNSWDVFFRPKQLYQGIGSWVADPFASSNSGSFPLLFSTFLFITYVMLYGLTQLQAAKPAVLAPVPNSEPA